MKKYGSNGEFKKALEKSLGHTISNKIFNELMFDRHPPFSSTDLQEVLSDFGIESELHVTRTIPEIINAIAEEVTLWQEINLHLLEPQLREVRQAMFGSPKHLSIKKANALIDDFLKSEDQPVRAAYVHLFIERSITAQDMTRYFSELKPNEYECLLAVMALIMNRSYLSGVEALWYFLTGQRIVAVGIFNPTITLVSYRLVQYLQHGGRPTRSLLSPKEKALLQLTFTSQGKPSPVKLWPVWNKQNPKWAYDSWRMFWKDFQRAKRRLLKTYDMAYETEKMQLQDPEHFWEKWKTIANST
jgi:hypothetical protein